MMTIALQLVLASIAFAILRPQTYDRSAWRALITTGVLTVPLALTAAGSMPLFDPSIRSAAVDPKSSGFWCAIWLLGGTMACATAALVSAVGRWASNREGSADRGRATKPFALLRLGIVATILLVFLGGGFGLYGLLSLPVSIHRSHVVGNVPKESDFDSFLERDLTDYFRNEDSTVVKVEYELLRKRPTQTGVAYPKFYAWVHVTRSTGPPRTGVVRVAAVDGTGFDVTHFLASESIRSEPERVTGVFPAALSRVIHERVRRSTSEL